MTGAPAGDWDRRAVLWFILPSALLGTLGFLGALPSRAGVSPDTTVLIAALGGLAGVSGGFILSDHMAPDGWKGFGRAAAVWTGAAMHAPLAALVGPFGERFFVMALWVMWSSVLYAGFHTLSAGRAIRFAAVYQGGGAVAFAVSARFPDAAGWIIGGMLLFGPLPAIWLNDRLRFDAEPTATAAATVEEEEEEPIDVAESVAPSLREREIENVPPVPWPAVPPQLAGGGELFARWLVAVAIDYLAVTVILIAGLRFLPGVLGTALGIIATLTAFATYHPTGEGLGGTIGQRLTGIRLIKPGHPNRRPSVSDVVDRQVMRVAIFWGVLAVLEYWAAEAFHNAEERTNLAKGAGAFPHRPWMFIER